MYPGAGWYGGGWDDGWYSAEFWQSRAPFAQHATTVLLVPPVEEPITIAEAKLRAGLDWADGDPRDALMATMIAAARARVEADTGRALLTQTRIVRYDILRSPVIQLPGLARPTQEISAIETTDYYGTPTTIDPTLYTVDLEAGRIFFSWPGVQVYWNVRPFQGWEVTVIAGRPTAADLLAVDPALVQAVGMLVAHLATMGRDLVVEDRRLTQTPQGYADLLAAYLPATVA
jgi:uncharacterized phiE125 gp8 family phage protein